ncbi:hypothetical protein NW064_02205 [Mycoplasmopsis felis]|uniref:hypothetical protein n=1 Tax=Mycoplasmopsis felis TaxID=33923 RepID=UPI0021AF8DF9|nr:hypothetical protein [Mycoplasmopsis felis]MCU9932300.1 hypothetical protein [Mycoplasmopsis felis]UWW01199.1 hypothetical protein NW064_02205 [Mycoplasmopsis felis]
MLFNNNLAMFISVITSLIFCSLSNKLVIKFLNKSLTPILLFWINSSLVILVINVIFVSSMLEVILLKKFVWISFKLFDSLNVLTKPFVSCSKIPVLSRSWPTPELKLWMNVLISLFVVIFKNLVALLIMILIELLVSVDDKPSKITFLIEFLNSVSLFCIDKYCFTISIKEWELLNWLWFSIKYLIMLETTFFKLSTFNALLITPANSSLLIRFLVINPFNIWTQDVSYHWT